MIGSVGFMVDASILLLLVNKLSFEISYSRFFSFLTAVFITWLLNRKFTFKKGLSSNKKKEYLSYLIIQVIGALLNYIIFINLVYFYEFFEEHLILPLAIASLFGMFFNFFMIRKKVYKSIS